jgi:hypothetical protein
VGASAVLLSAIPTRALMLHSSMRRLRRFNRILRHIDRRGLGPVRQRRLCSRRKLREHRRNQLPPEARRLFHPLSKEVSVRLEAACRVWCAKHIFRRLQKSSERHRRRPKRKSLISAHLMTKVMRAVIANETEFKRRSWKVRVSLLYTLSITPGCYHIYFIASMVS